MASFKSWYSYNSFSHHVRNKYRYRFDSETKLFLETVKKTAGNKVKHFAKGECLYRAQEGCDNELEFIEDINDHIEHEKPYCMERMLPNPEYSYEGRANPKGIAVLYVATHYHTAICEMRPWKNKVYTVARMDLNRDIKVIDCTRSGGRRLYFSTEENPEPKPRAMNRIVWSWINSAFSEPASRHNSSTDYVPTQILAEVFRSEGYDGILYSSNFDTKGDNLALFDKSCVTPIFGKVVNITKAEVDYEEISGPHASTKYM
ncbi:MAG TPA: RES domain-containing protein [Bacteroidetes bacterium]|nr:RES domain protein [bacterium BMS3Bbin04]HDO65768.1 RES domain-containing protein [Bacteroidota bacterium]HEX04893.1 RES domain-containing protein [Bacteroidota bacterium]